MITKVSKELLDFLKEFESFRSKPYLCPSKVPTIGYGTTYYFDTKKRVTMADKPINEDEALRLKLGHINEVFAPLVNKLCRDDLKQNEFNALVLLFITQDRLIFQKMALKNIIIYLEM